MNTKTNFYIQSSAKSFAIVSLKRQIENVVRQLQKKYENHQKLVSIIENLHKKYVQNQQSVQQQQVKCFVEKSASFESNFQNKVVKVEDILDGSKNKHQTKYIIYAKPYPLTFKSQIQEILFYQKKIGAQTFIRWGQSYQIYKDQVRKRGGYYQVTQRRYRKIANQYVTDAYKKIEDFLSKCCRYEVKRQFKLRGVQVYSVLFNCRKYFTTKELITYLKFIALLFQDQCTSIQVTRSSVIQFYQRSRQFIQEKLLKTQKTLLDTDRQIRSRNGSSKNNKMLNAESGQDKLIDIYMQVQKVAQTKEKYYKMYGYHQQFVSNKSVQYVIYRHVRRAIRTLQDYYHQHYMILPKMIDLNDMRVKIILTNPEATLLRIMILKFSRIRQLNISILADLINEVRAFFEQRQKRLCSFQGSQSQYNTIQENDENQTEQ